MARTKTSTPWWKLERSGGAKAASIDVEHPPFEPRAPRVNLTPAAIRDAIAVRKIRKGYVFGGLALLCVGVLIWLAQNGSILIGEQQLATAQADNAAVAAQVKAFDPVERLYSEITTQESFIDDAVASEVVPSRILDQLTRTGGKGVSFASLGLNVTGIPKPELAARQATALNPCPNADPFSKDIAVGCLTFAAITKSREDVAAFLTRAEANPMFIGPYITASTVIEDDKGAQVVSFSGSAGVSLEALRHPLTGPEITAIREAATQASGDSPSNPTAK